MQNITLGLLLVAVNTFNFPRKMWRDRLQYLLQTYSLLKFTHGISMNSINIICQIIFSFLALVGVIWIHSRPHFTFSPSVFQITRNKRLYKVCICINRSSNTRNYIVCGWCVIPQVRRWTVCHIGIERLLWTGFTGSKHISRDKRIERWLFDAFLRVDRFLATLSNYFLVCFSLCSYSYEEIFNNVVGKESWQSGKRNPIWRGSWKGLLRISLPILNPCSLHFYAA